MDKPKFIMDIVGTSADSLPATDTLYDGSTYYTADTQKLYVLCKGTWYLQGDSEEAGD